MKDTRKKQSFVAIFISVLYLTRSIDALWAQDAAALFSYSIGISACLVLWHILSLIVRKGAIQPVPHAQVLLTLAGAYVLSLPLLLINPLAYWAGCVVLQFVFTVLLATGIGQSYFKRAKGASSGEMKA